jgi:hypothetical protein
MIKFILIITKVLTATIIALLFSSCKYSVDLNNGIDGNGTLKTETRSATEPFTKVFVKRGIDVVIEQADVAKIVVETDENLLEHITTKIENGRLTITSDENIGDYKKRTVYVTLPIINTIETTSGSSVKCKNTLKGTNLVAKSSSGSDINVTAEFDEIKCESTSGSEINISGKALKLNTASSSGSEINAGKLLANEIYSQSTSGSSTIVRPLVKLSGKASSGSSIEYEGNPKTINKEETSGGSVSSY